MSAFQLGPSAAAIVAENQAVPHLTILNLSSVGVVLFGREAVEQLRDACNAALGSDVGRHIDSFQLHGGALVFHVFADAGA